MKFSVTLLALGVALPSFVSAQVHCQYSKCGSANEWCAAGARDRMLYDVLGCDPALKNYFVHNGGVTDAWYGTSPCVARLSGSGSPARIACGNIISPFNLIIEKCFSAADNGLGSIQWSDKFYVKISTCPGSWNKRRGLEARDEPPLNRREAQGLKPMTKEAELEQLVNYLVNEEKSTDITGASVFSLPHSKGGQVSVCELAKLQKSAELEAKYGC